MNPNDRTLTSTVDRVDRPSTRTHARHSTGPLRIAAALVLVATLALAHAQTRFDPSAAAFEDGPSSVGVSLGRDGDGVLVQLVPAGRGTLPNATTEFVGDVPTDVLGRVDAQHALHQSEALQSLTGGVVLIHEDQRLTDVAGAYRAELEALGFGLIGDVSRGSGRELTFRSGDRIVRVAAHQQGNHVQVYVGR